MTIQLSIDDALKARDKGIEKSVQHANIVTPGWSDLALREFKNFINHNPGEFMAEDFRSWCAMKDNFPFPPHARAFGAVILNACKAGWIRKVRIGQVKNIKAHRANAAVWEPIKKAS